MRRLLVITYYWPPAGGAGVQRWLKFSKYLPQYGWEPVVLTVDPQFAVYPALDTTLAKDIPDQTKVYRTKATDWFRLYVNDKSKVPAAGFAVNMDYSLKGKISRFIRGNLFIPDPRRGWNKFAFRKACEIIETLKINHIITTSPPHSTQLIGLRLKKRFPGITWISDLRDAWTDIYYYKLFYPSKISAAVDAGYERKVLRNADRIITVGNNLAKIFSSKVKEAGAKIKIIPNGYDEEDFKSVQMTLPERFTITYIGTISEAYPTDAFIKALSVIEKNGHDFLLRFVGNIPRDIKTRIEGSISREKAEFLSYIEHPEVIKLLASSSLLLLIIPLTEKDNAITPGKLFEYIATGKPVLYIGPVDGDPAGHLRLCGHSGIFSGKSSDEIEEFILRTMRSGDAGSFNKHPEYSRKVLSQKLGKVLGGLQ
jgi:glycosyltransferase involved in cell wall biosynthesis